MRVHKCRDCGNRQYTSIACNVCQGVEFKVLEDDEIPDWLAEPPAEGEPPEVTATPKEEEMTTEEVVKLYGKVLKEEVEQRKKMRAREGEILGAGTLPSLPAQSERAIRTLRAIPLAELSDGYELGENESFIEVSDGFVLIQKTEWVKVEVDPNQVLKSDPSTNRTIRALYKRRKEEQDTDIDDVPEIDEVAEE